MDALAALRLQIEWGADEALGAEPLNRFGSFQAAEMPSTPPQQVAPSRPTATRSAAITIYSAVAVVERAQAAAAQARSLDELAAALAAFDGCALAATATSLVFGAGDPAASLMLVGDVPGADEDRVGRPFVGRDGQLLGRMLQSIGLSLESVRLSLVVPWRPPGGRQPTAAEVAVCLPFLWRHIALVAPARLVTVGALAMRALLGDAATPARSRGRWTDLHVAGLDRTVPLLPLVHPQQLASRPEQKAAVWRDLRQLRRTLDDNNG